MKTTAKTESDTKESEQAERRAKQNSSSLTDVKEDYPKTV